MENKQQKRSEHAHFYLALLSSHPVPCLPLMALACPGPAGTVPSSPDARRAETCNPPSLLHRVQRQRRPGTRMLVHSGSPTPSRPEVERLRNQPCGAAQCARSVRSKLRSGKPRRHWVSEGCRDSARSSIGGSLRGAACRGLGAGCAQGLKEDAQDSARPAPEGRGGNLGSQARPARDADPALWSPAHASGPGAPARAPRADL